MSRTKMNFKDGHFFVFGTDGPVSYHNQAGDALWEANWGADLTNHVGYVSDDKNYTFSYAKGSGKFVVHALTDSSHTKTHEGTGEPGFQSFRLAYCGPVPYCMQEKPDQVAVSKLSDKYEVVATAPGGTDAGSLLQKHLNSGAASGGGSSAGSKPAGRPGGGIRFPEDHAFMWTGDRKVTYKKGNDVLWEEQWDKDYSHHLAFVFDDGSYIFSYNPVNNKINLSLLGPKGAKDVFTSTWDGGWTSLKSYNHRGIQYIVAAKEGKHEVSSLNTKGVALVYSTTSGGGATPEDMDKVFDAFGKTLVVGETVNNLKFEDKHYFTYTTAGKVTYNDENRKLWEEDWGGKKWVSYMGFTVEDKNYLLLTDGGRGMSIELLHNTGVTNIFSGSWEYDFITYCMSHFAKKRYLIAGKANGTSIIHLTPNTQGQKNYAIVYETAEMDGRLAFEEYVRTLIGGDAQINFSKTSSASSSIRHLKYPNGYVFGYIQEDSGEVTYEAPDATKLWKLDWGKEYTHHVGFMIFGKNYLLSYKKATGDFDTRLLTPEDAILISHGTFDPNFDALRVAYFDEQPYLICNAPGKQAIYELTANSQKKVHEDAGDTGSSAEAVIKAVVANKKVAKLPNGYTAEFEAAKFSCKSPAGFLWDAPWDASLPEQHVGFVNVGEPFVISYDDKAPSKFVVDALAPTGPVRVASGELGVTPSALTPVYYNAKTYLVADSPDKHTVFAATPQGPVEVFAAPKTDGSDADKAFANFVESKLPSPSTPFSFVSDVDNVTPSGDHRPETHLVYPDETTLFVQPDRAVAYKKTPKNGKSTPIWNANFDPDVTHTVGFVDDAKDFALTFKHGQGTTQIHQLTPESPIETLKANIDPEWTSLDVLYHKNQPFLLATKPGKAAVYRLSPKSAELLIPDATNALTPAPASSTPSPLPSPALAAAIDAALLAGPKAGQAGAGAGAGAKPGVTDAENPLNFGMQPPGAGTGFGLAAPAAGQGQGLGLPTSNLEGSALPGSNPAAHGSAPGSGSAPGGYPTGLSLAPGGDHPAGLSLPPGGHAGTGFAPSGAASPFGLGAPHAHGHSPVPVPGGQTGPASLDPCSSAPHLGSAAAHPGAHPAGSAAHPSGSGAGAHPAGTGAGAHPAGTGAGAHPAGTGAGAHPAGTGAGAHPAGTGAGAHPAGTGAGAHPAGAHGAGAGAHPAGTPASVGGVQASLPPATDLLGYAASNPSAVITSGAIYSEHSSHTTCAQNIFFPGGRYFLSIPCNGSQVSYNQLLWEAAWDHFNFSHCVVYTWQGGNYILSYSEHTGVYTINQLVNNTAVEVSRGQWATNWASFSVSYYAGSVVLVSTSAAKQDVGVLTGTGYVLLQSRDGFESFVKAAIEKK